MARAWSEASVPKYPAFLFPAEVSRLARLPRTTQVRMKNGEPAVSNEAAVTVVAGSYLTADEDRVRLPHVWTSGGFDTRTWQSTGIDYVLEINSPASARDVEQLQLRVEH
jgi:hypothetical protein